MGLDATPGYSEGIDKPSMPNLQSLISSGILYNNFWSSPVCTPTRATILTGKYGVNTGIVGVGDNISTIETSVQSYLDDNADNDYNHAVVGKWHLSNSASNPTDMGIDYYAGLLTGGVQSYTNWQLTENGSTRTSNEYTTTKFTDLAIDWLEDQTEEQPWFLWLAYNAPHTPFHLPPTNLHSRGNLPSDAASISADPLPYFLAALEAMDSEIGRLLNSLDDAQLSNTIIIFIGDNGTPNQVAQSPFRRLRVKGSLYQGGINVPMIISGKGVNRSGSTENALLSSVDLFATIADLAGVGTTTINDSQSFTGTFDNTNISVRDFVYSEVDENNVSGYTIRNNTYKLIVFDNGSNEFYNLIDDPYENNDLLQGTLSAVENSAMNLLLTEAASIRN